MAGPTSVSALLHSATMVAAGAYALIILGPAVSVVGWFGPAVVAIGLSTALVGGVVALGEVHGKRILAASTAAQYGLMFTAVGLGAPGAAAAHLVAHALLKSQLFLAVGVGRTATGTGDVRRWRLGGRMPYVAYAAAFGALALTAVPPVGAAWTKEQIVAAAVTAGPSVGALAFLAGLLSTVYALRLHLLAFGRDRTGTATAADGPGTTERRSSWSACSASAPQPSGCCGCPEHVRSSSGWWAARSRQGMRGSWPYPCCWSRSAPRSRWWLLATTADCFPTGSPPLRRIGSARPRGLVG